jgi:hypothetical protein
MCTLERIFICNFVPRLFGQVNTEMEGKMKSKFVLEPDPSWIKTMNTLFYMYLILFLFFLFFDRKFGKFCILACRNFLEVFFFDFS